MNADQAARRREVELADLKRVMDTDHGRRVIRRILARCKPEGSLLENNPAWRVGPELGIWICAGQREIGNWVLTEVIEASPDGVQKMNAEAYTQKVMEERENG